MSVCSLPFDDHPKQLAQGEPIRVVVIGVQEEQHLAQADPKTAAKISNREKTNELVQVLFLVGKDDVVENQGCAPKDRKARRRQVDAVQFSAC